MPILEAPVASDPSSSVTGTVPADVAGFRVVRRLASGEHVDVDLGFDPDLGAVVLVSPRAGAASDRALHGDSTDAAAFVSAYAALARVRHPHVVRLLDMGATDGRRPVAVLERLEPTTAAALLARRGTIDLGEAITLLAPVGEALDACHDAGVAHGALDASAVLFRPDGAPVLASFGSATAASPVPVGARALDARYPADREALARLVRLVLSRVEGLDAGDAEEIAAATGSADRPGAALGAALFSRGAAAPLRFDESPLPAPTRAGRPVDALPTVVTGAAAALALVAARLRALVDSVRPRYRVLLLAGAVAVVAVVALVSGGAGSDASMSRGAAPSPTPTRTAAAPPTARPSQDPAITADDPVAAVVALAELRAACLSAASTGCLAGVDEDGSAAARDDRALVTGSTPAAVDDAMLETEAPELVELLGGAALVRLHNGGGSGPASVLVMRTEAGWRLRDYLGE